ncbi:NAD(P)-binding protein [Coniophora puteana RWD-64-598 SS2]|uniref:NAD(P)-binding protein n=1 Tax=Coniophora puteana (strain RWD-64-598) TaxID=741705 RepID=A0A5M3M9E5_CONPW|nr:NAD(P)-binding protein [Coniophora puteana RWD-64-598 SS2]EIW75707.1 NAD(P)-binding protein [Coniophora puteana RWD-64-598 SS2]
MNTTQPRVWLVTGASTGFGRHMTELLLKKGDIVIATLRRPEVLSDLTSAYPSSRLLVLKLDVTKARDVHDAFERGIEAFGRVDVVFNNAGQLCVGELESVDDETARRVMEVNFWGATHVTKEAIRVFREVNSPRGGRLLQVSSRAGLIGTPANAHYTASKHALEGLTESVAQELSPDWNIKITMIEPGPFRTAIFGTNIIHVQQHPAYADPSMPGSQFIKLACEDFPDGDPIKAVEIIEKVTHLEDPPLRLPLHWHVIAALRDKAKALGKTADDWEKWSDGIYLEGTAS